MGVADVLKEGPGTAFMLCNEAIVRGALEADVKVVSAYPGSPTTEILDTFSDIAPKFDYKMEIAVNEKVALETCAGASMVGMRSITSMKSVGMKCRIGLVLLSVIYWCQRRHGCGRRRRPPSTLLPD